MNADRAFPRGPKTPGADVADRTPAADGDFAQRLMAAIEREPAPTPTRNFVSAVRTRSAHEAAAALWVAWHLGTVRSWRIAPGVRARSLALVLAVACVMATGSLVAAAALQVAAEPVVDLFQFGVDEQGPVENVSPDDDQPEHQLDEGDQPGVEAPATDDQHDQPGVDEPDSDSAGQDDRPGVNEPGANEQGDHSGANEQDATDQGDQPGIDQPGSGNVGQSQSNGENTSTAGSDSGGSSGANGANEDGSSNDDNSNP